MWSNEEGVFSLDRLLHLLRVFGLRLIIASYFFIPGGEQQRRRSIFWQILQSDLAEERYLDYTLMLGLRGYYTTVYVIIICISCCRYGRTI